MLAVLEDISITSWLLTHLSSPIFGQWIDRRVEARASDGMALDLMVDEVALLRISQMLSAIE